MYRASLRTPFILPIALSCHQIDSQYFMKANLYDNDISIVDEKHTWAELSIEAFSFLTGGPYRLQIRVQFMYHLLVILHSSKEIPYYRSAVMNIIIFDRLIFHFICIQHGTLFYNFPY
jgi:hypothetical protein